MWLTAGGRTGTARTRTRVPLVRWRRRSREEEEEGREGGMVVASQLEERRPSAAVVVVEIEKEGRGDGRRE